VPAAGYPLEFVSAAGIRGKGVFGKLIGASLMLYGYAESRRIIKEFRPDAVLGVGGYASLPLLLAARGIGVPSYIHEQNAIPGMTNRALSKVVDRVFITLEESSRFFPKEKTVLTGNPLRREIVDAGKAVEGEAGSMGEDFLDRLRFHLLVFGGSQGAHAINMAMIKAAPFLAPYRDMISIRHQTGKNDLEEVRGAYREHGIKADVSGFITDMALQYRKADLVICRAGATTIAEVTACAKPALFIPFPHAVDDHQRRNAEAMLKKDACMMLLEDELSGELLSAMVTNLMHDRERLAAMADNAASLASVDAAKRIVDLISGSEGGKG